MLVVDLGEAPLDFVERRAVAPEPDLVIRSSGDDASGEQVATWGGTGGGPGEFRRLEWLATLPPDTLAAGDGGLRRITVLDAGGQYIRSFGTADRVDPASNPIPPRPMVLLADGSAIGAVFSSPAPTEDTARPPVEILVLPPAGGSMRELGTWRGEELALFEQDGSLQVTQPPFGRRLHIATASDGVWIADDSAPTVRQPRSNFRRAST